jgi:hypothetical protein
MFGYDSAEEFFAYQDQLDLEAAQRAQAENELEAYWEECAAEDEAAEAQCAQYEEDLLHFEDNADIPF